MPAPFLTCFGKSAFRAGCLVCLTCLLPSRTSWASGPDENIPPAAVLVNLEQRADHADVREQCFLYSQLLHTLTELEGQQIGAGDDQAATSTLGQIDRIATKLKSSENKDSKKLKNAETLMQHTTRRLGDMLHLASGEERTAMKATLDKLNHVHDEILALVFSK